jgi:hypothetical protein
MEKVIVGCPAQALAATIAALSEPAPASAFVETTILHWEKATKELKKNVKDNKGNRIIKRY